MVVSERRRRKKRTEWSLMRPTILSNSKETILEERSRREMSFEETIEMRISQEAAIKEPIDGVSLEGTEMNSEKTEMIIEIIGMSAGERASLEEKRNLSGTRNIGMNISETMSEEMIFEAEETKIESAKKSEEMIEEDSFLCVCSLYPICILFVFDFI